MSERVAKMSKAGRLLESEIMGPIQMKFGGNLNRKALLELCA